MFDKLNAILSLFSDEKPEWAPAAAARALRLPRSTAYRLLARMAGSGLLDQDDDSGRYRLGIRLAALGSLAQRSSSLQRAAAPVLRALAGESRETASLMVRGGAEGVTVLIAASQQPLMVPGQIGGRVPLHASAGGKVLLAFMPDDLRSTLFTDLFTAQTSTTITDPAVLTRHLADIRTAGYATGRGEWIDGVYAAAAPVRSFTGEVIGALSVGGPRARVTDERLQVLVKLVTAAAAEVSSAVGHVPR
ncbi:MAG: IclR family transcriptional regulator [Gemmatimonadaceae bacterium]|nr:IclR family transcriptional regulator [Gemmatimonadaceae bacterium]